MLNWKFRLSNPLLRKARKRYRQPYQTTVQTSTDGQKTEILPTLRKIKRGVCHHTSRHKNTTFNFAPTKPTHHPNKIV